MDKGKESSNVSNTKSYYSQINKEKDEPPKTEEWHRITMIKHGVLDSIDEALRQNKSNTEFFKKLLLDYSEEFEKRSNVHELVICVSNYVRGILGRDKRDNIPTKAEILNEIEKYTKSKELLLKIKENYTKFINNEGELIRIDNINGENPIFDYAKKMANSLVDSRVKEVKIEPEIQINKKCI